MKRIGHVRISLAIITLLFISSCARFDIDQNDNSVQINAIIDANDTKAYMDQSGESLNYIAKWHGTENLTIFHQGYDTYNYTTAEAHITDVQAGGRGASFSYSIPKEWGLKGDVSYTHACFTKATYPTLDAENKKIYVSASIIRQPLRDFELPLYFVGQATNGRSEAVFHHYYTYEILHVRNSSDEEIDIKLNGFESDNIWYRESASFCVDDGNVVPGQRTEKDPVFSSAPVKIYGHGTENIVSAYIPTGFKISNAVMVAEIGGQIIKSSNTKSSNVDLKIGHAYHMYAEWDGKELKFVDAFADAAITVSTFSLEFGKVNVGESKTLSFDITNNTSEQISIGDIWSEDTNFTVDWMAGTIGPRETQTVNVTFSPDRAYSVSGAFTVGNEKESYTVTYTAEGVGADVNAEYVDLGLSVKWATCNLGATKPEEYGLYYQWGDTQGYSSDTSDGMSFGWSTYKWCNGSKYSLTKYNTDSSYGTVDNKTVLEMEDDAARAALGVNWRMPTDAEWTELRENCTWTWTKDYNGTGVAGRIVTSNKTGYTDKSIFLPVAGRRISGDLIGAGWDSKYWSSSLDTYGPFGAWGVYFDSDDVYRNYDNRYYGQPVRPVYTETEATPSISVTPTDLDFGTVKVGSSATASFTITNTGSTAASVSISAPSSPVTSDVSGNITLNAGASKTVTLTYSPKEKGSVGGSISVVSGGNTTNVRYSGSAEEGTVSGGPLTFTSTGSTTIAMDGDVPVSLEYNLNGTGWKTYTLGQTITLADKNKVSLRAGAGGNTSFGQDDYHHNHFVMTGQGTIAASGNIMSLLDADCGLTSIPTSYCFYSLFSFCTSLTTAPELPATTLAEGCYESMFYSCKSLTTAPELPAITLADRCYRNMFTDCASLTTAPELPATTLAPGCYNDMFFYCTSLTTAPELPATTLAEGCYESMFYNCTSLTTAPKLPATTLEGSCYSGMFNGCTSLVNAPELPATTLAEDCYRGMFFECTSLTTAPELPATTLAPRCYWEMFSYCERLASAPELPATTLAASCYGGMFYCCSKLKSVKMMATDISAWCCLDQWLIGVSSRGTFVKNPAATWTHSDLGIPSGWTIIDAE